jgi:hypothetical protein
VRRKSIYIAGPMSGLPEFNFPAFFAAQRELEAEGWKVFNPAEKDQEKDLDAKAVRTGDAQLAIAKGFDFREAFLWDMTKIIQGNGIYMLKGWEQSPGAIAEHRTACAMQKHYPEFVILYQ